MLQRPKNFIENRGEMLQRSDISKKFTAGSRKWPSAAFYFVGSIIENSEPLPGSETTLI